MNVGYTGHLYEGRGIGLLIEVARRCAWLQLHIVGGEPDDIQRWQSASKGMSNVDFYGYVDPVETPRYRDMCDVLAAPYQRVVKVAGDRIDTSKYMSPLKIFEYMASAKAIVCSDLPVLREILRDGETALLCKPDDVDDWCRAMIRLRDDPGLGERLAANAFREYEGKYTWEGRAARVLEKFAPAHRVPT
jgi:glycosyltransferase involved in cell wall biosynthesis